MRIVADGDSWFDYPWWLNTGGGIPSHLEKLLGQPIPNYAHHGDGTQQMLSLDQRKQIESYLPTTDILLFSGGGNDIAGDQFCIWLNDNKDNDVLKAIDWDRLNAALDLTMATFNDLAQLRDEFNANCWIITHAYDFPIPSDKGILWLGPWLKPSLDYCGWTNTVHQQTIVKLALSSLNQRIKNWGIPNHLHVNSQGILLPSDWGNEIHPNRSGFNKQAVEWASVVSTLL